MQSKIFIEVHENRVNKLEEAESNPSFRPNIIMDKSYAMHFPPKRKCKNKRPLSLAKKKIPWTDKFIYLGIQISSKNRLECNGRIKKAKEDLAKIKHILLARSKCGVSPRAARDIYTSTILAAMLYGCEIAELTKKDLDKAEKVHKEAARIILGVPYKEIAAWLTMEELGWMRVQAIIDERTLHFIGNIHLNHPVLPKLALKYSQEISSDFSGRINLLQFSQ